MQKNSSRTSTATIFESLPLKLEVSKSVRRFWRALRAGDLEVPSPAVSRFLKSKAAASRLAKIIDAKGEVEVKRELSKLRDDALESPEEFGLPPKASKTRTMKIVRASYNVMQREILGKELRKYREPDDADSGDRKHRASGRSPLAKRGPTPKPTGTVKAEPDEPRKRKKKKKAKKEMTTAGSVGTAPERALGSMVCPICGGPPIKRKLKHCPWSMHA